MRSISCRVHTTSKGEIFPLNKAFRFRLRCASAFPAPHSPLPSVHCPLPSVCAAHALPLALLRHLVGWPLPSASSTASFSLPLHFSLLAMHCGLCGSWLRLRVFAAVVSAGGGSGGGAAGLRLALCCAFVAIVKLVVSARQFIMIIIVVACRQPSPSPSCTHPANFENTNITIQSTDRGRGGGYLLPSLGQQPFKAHANDFGF